MDIQTIRIIQTSIVIIVLIAANFFTKRGVKTFEEAEVFSAPKIDNPCHQFLLTLTAVVFISGICVKQSIAVFISSIMPSKSPLN